MNLSDIGSGSGSTNQNHCNGKWETLQKGAWRDSQDLVHIHGAFDNLIQMHGVSHDNLSTFADSELEWHGTGWFGHQLGGTRAHVNSSLSAPRNFNQTWDPWDFDETVNLSCLAIESDCEKQGVASHWSVWMVRHCGDTAGPTLCHREWGFRQTPQNLWMFNFYRTSNLHQICTSELKHCKSGFRRKVILVRPEEGLWPMQSLLLMTLPDKSLGMPLVWNDIFLLDISLWFVCDNATSPPSVPFLFLSFILVYGKISAFLQNHTCRLDMIYIHIYAPLLIIYNLK